MLRHVVQTREEILLFVSARFLLCGELKTRGLCTHRGLEYVYILAGVELF